MISSRFIYIIFEISVSTPTTFLFYKCDQLFIILSVKSVQIFFLLTFFEVVETLHLCLNAGAALYLLIYRTQKDNEL